MQAGALTNNLVPEAEGAPEASDDDDDGLAELLPAPAPASAALPIKALLCPKLPDVLLAAPAPGAASAAAAALGWPPPLGLPAEPAADAAAAMDMDGGDGAAGEEPATGGDEGGRAGSGTSLSPPRTPSPAVPAFLMSDACAAPAAPASSPDASQPGGAPQCSPVPDPDSAWEFGGLPAACYGVPSAPPPACGDSPHVSAGGEAAAELHLYAVELVVVQAAAPPPPPPEPEAGAAAEEGAALSAAPDLAGPEPSAGKGEAGPGAGCAPAAPRAPADASAAELEQPLGLLAPRLLPPLPPFRLELSTGAVAEARLVHCGLVRATQRELDTLGAFHSVLVDPWDIRNLRDTPAAALGAAGAAALEARAGECCAGRAAAPAVSVTGLTVGVLLGTPAAAGKKRKAADMGQEAPNADEKQPPAAEAQPAEGGMQAEGPACSGDGPMPHARLCDLETVEDPRAGRYLLAPLLHAAAPAPGELGAPSPAPGRIDWGQAEIASHGFQQVRQALPACAMREQLATHACPSCSAGILSV